MDGASIILIVVVRLTLNVDTQNKYCTHRADPRHTNQTSAAPSHAPFPAILDDDLTSQLGWIDSPGPGPAGSGRVRLSLPGLYLLYLPLCVCGSMHKCRAYHERVSDENENQSSLNSQCGRKFHKSFYTKHLPNLGCTPFPPVHCVLLLKGYLCSPY